MPIGCSSVPEPLSYLPQVPAREETCSVRGVRHRVLRWGPEQVEPILLLHGFQDSAETFQFLVDALPRDWAFAAPDWRGFGGSEGNDGAYWFPDYLADLDQLATVLAPNGRLRIVGHSMGGNVAALYAGVRPDRVAWLMSLEGFGLPRVSAEQAPDRYARWLDELVEGVTRNRYASLAQFTEIVRRRNPRVDAARAAYMARAWSRPVVLPDANAAAPADQAAAADQAVELRHDPWHRLINPTVYRRDEAEACWRRVTAPVLFVLGEHSEFRGRLLADGTEQYFQALFPRITLATLRGVGHMMHLEDPALVARELCDWLAGGP